jgi:hypothetical protein
MAYHTIPHQQLTASHIRESLLDFDDQVRQALEGGNIQVTMRHIARRLVRPIS